MPIDENLLDDINKNTSMLRGFEGGNVRDTISDMEGSLSTLSFRLENLEGSESPSQFVTNNITQSITRTRTVNQVGIQKTWGKAGLIIGRDVPVYLDPDDRKVKHYNSEIDKSFYMGLNTSPVSENGDVEAVLAGPYTFNDNKTPLKPLFIDNSGSIVQEDPTGTYLYIGHMQTEKSAILSVGVGYGNGKFKHITADTVTATTGTFGDLTTDTLTASTANFTYITVATTGNFGTVSTTDLLVSGTATIQALNVATTIQASTVSTTDIYVDNIYERTGAGNINVENNLDATGFIGTFASLIVPSVGNGDEAVVFSDTLNMDSNSITTAAIDGGTP